MHFYWPEDYDRIVNPAWQLNRQSRMRPSTPRRFQAHGCGG
jgi:hypothetical protein